MTGTHHQPDQPADVTRLLRHLGGDGDRRDRAYARAWLYDRMSG